MFSNTSYYPYIRLMGQSLELMDLSTKDAYANFLAQTYYYVSHSTSFLAFSAGLMKKEDKKYFNRFIQHISEENNHELLALRDLQNLGYGLENFPESNETRMLWETQYYKIQHVDPLTLIGYIIPLEMFSADYFPSFLEKVNSQFGKKTSSFVRVHAEEDPDHIDEALAILDKIDINRKDLIISNIGQTAVAYSNLLDSLSTKPITATQFSEASNNQPQTRP